MLLAAAHLHPAWTIPVAAIIAGWIAWYWFRLGLPTVPPSRRKIRRVSLAFMLLSLPMFVRALSVLDPATQQREYVVAWSIAFAMVLIVMLTAALDALNTLRLMNRHTRDELRRAAGELTKAVEKRRSQIASPRPRHTKNGEAKP